MVLNTLLPYHQALGVTGVRYQSNFIVSTIPWSMKAAIGLLSDAVPILGYHKRSYIVLVSIIGGLGLAVLSVIELDSKTTYIAALLLVLFNYQVASVDLLTEGKYAEMMVARPETGSDLVSFAWGLYSVGTLVGSLISAVILSIAPPRYSFMLIIPIAIQVIIPALTGAFPEERLPPGQRGVRYDRIRRYPGMFKLSVFMTIGAILVGGSALFSPKAQSNVSITVSIIVAALGFIWLPKSLRKPNLYLFLSYTLYLSIQGPMDYWMTASQSCVPGGPNFRASFYVSYSNFVGSVASILGVVFFQMHLSQGTFRRAFMVSHAIKIAASLFDVMIVTRMNLAMGISDLVMFTLGDAVLFQATNRLDIMPAIVLTSKVCKPGMEASVYALLVSYQNLGVAVSRTMGDALVDELGVRTLEPCKFDKLPLAIVIAHVLLPALVFPLIYWLIPDSLMTDDLVVDEDDEEGEENDDDDDVRYDDKYDGVTCDSRRGYDGQQKTVAVVSDVRQIRAMETGRPVHKDEEDSERTGLVASRGGRIDRRQYAGCVGGCAGDAGTSRHDADS